MDCNCKFIKRMTHMKYRVLKQLRRQVKMRKLADMDLFL